MFPIRDTTPTRTFPLINYILIVVTLYVFYLQLTAPDIDAFTNSYAFIPAHFHIFEPLTYGMIITSIFMHGGIMHIVSIWFLHIFGDNVEDSLGHMKYLFFYLAAGIIATLTQYIIDPGSSIPVIGASGAISGVAGAYFVLFRFSKVKTLVVLFLGLIDIVDIPVWLFLGYWFFVQLFSGIGSLTTIDTQTGGIAFFAHVGGFVFGYFIAKIIANKPLERL